MGESKKSFSSFSLTNAYTQSVPATLPFLMSLFLWESFNISAGSMHPTLLRGYQIFISKYSYRYSRYSFRVDMPFISNEIFSTLPERGNIAVFRIPTNPKQNYIKRIVGLPGNQIQIKKRHPSYQWECCQTTSSRSIRRAPPSRAMIACTVVIPKPCQMVASTISWRNRTQKLLITPRFTMFLKAISLVWGTIETIQMIAEI
jgi:signal peptidase I